jgi:hypothetical protein
VDDHADEDAEPKEDLGDDDISEPDPFIATPHDIAPSRPAQDLAQRRALAIQEALHGAHRIYLTTSAGPGSLAEALAGLLREGRVTAQFIDTPDDEPHILYEPPDDARTLNE